MITAPAGLLCLSILFWGSQSGFLFLAIPMGILVESSRWAKSRWELSQVDLNRIWHLCTLLFFVGAALAFATSSQANPFTGYLQSNNWAERSRSLETASTTIMVFIEWQPIIFFPLMLAQAWGNHERIDFRQFSIIERRRRSKQSRQVESDTEEEDRGTNFSFIYFALVVGSSAAANDRSGWFYPMLCGLVAFALWNSRSTRFQFSTWVSGFGLAVIFGYLGQSGLKHVADFTENLHTAWVSGLGGNGFDDAQSRTAMGRIGRLKASPKIVMRLKPGNKGAMPALLRGTAYDVFKGGSWYGVSSGRTPLRPESDNTTWRIHPAHESEDQIHVELSLKNGSGLLPVPAGTVSLLNLHSFGLTTNRFICASGSG